MLKKEKKNNANRLKILNFFNNVFIPKDSFQTFAFVS